jgi:hypothetical protein
MIGTGARHLKGSITPKLSDKMRREFHRQWEFLVGVKAHLETDGETLTISNYGNWNENQLKYHVEKVVLAKAVNLVDLKATPRTVTYNS